MASKPGKLRVMLDATVLVAGSCWPRWPYEVLRAGIRGEFQLVLCPYVVEQARRVVRTRFPAYGDGLERFLSLAQLELVPDPSPEEVAAHKGLVRDETDVPVVLAALNARVDCLVSEDKDLTAQDDTTAVLREKLTVRLSGTFLREVLGWGSEELEAVRRRNWGALDG